MSIWENEERSTDLALMLAAGKSFRQIGADLSARYGDNISRNACIGRARRMGLETAKPKRDPDRAPKPARPRKLRMVMNGSGPVWIENRFAPAPTLRCIEIVPRHLTLMELGPNDCRYPYGGDSDNEPITFCGHQRWLKTVKDIDVLKPYCRAHCDLAFIEPKPAKERPYLLRNIARVVA